MKMKKHTRFYLLFYVVALANIGCISNNKVLYSKLSTEKGFTCLEGEYFSGEAYDLYDSGLISKSFQFKDGKKNGYSFQWYPNKVIKEKGNYFEGKRRGKHIGLWPDKSNRFEKRFDKNGLMNGEQKQWHRNGILSRISKYDQGRESGRQKGWRENGDLRYNYTIINNKRYGYMGSKICVPPV